MVVPLSIFLVLTPVTIIILVTFHKLFIIKESGITTSLALIISYVLGVMAGAGLVLESIILSILVTFVFFLKDVYDPFFGIVNLRLLYTLFTVILILSYIGYAIIKVLGVKALGYFSFFGGLIHSEATTVSLVEMCSGAGGRLDRMMIKGILLSTIAMIVRNTILVLSLAFLLKGGIVVLCSLSLLPPIIVGCAISGFLSVGMSPNMRGRVSTNLSPLNLRSAIKTTLAFFCTLLTITTVSTYLSSLGIAMTSALSGLISAEAAIFALFSLASKGIISFRLFMQSSLLAIAMAIMNKVLFAKVAGAPSRLMKELMRCMFFLSISCVMGLPLTLLY